jgi:hypothetical protein
VYPPPMTDRREPPPPPRPREAERPPWLVESDRSCFDNLANAFHYVYILQDTFLPGQTG